MEILHGNILHRIIIEICDDDLFSLVSHCLLPDFDKRKMYARCY